MTPTVEPAPAAGEEPAALAPPPERRPPRRRRRGLVLGVVTLAVAAGVLAFFLWPRDWESTDDAFLEAHVVPVAPRLAGRVSAVHVTENEQVQAGQLLVELDPRETDVAVQEAEAAVAAAQAGVDAAQAQLELTHATTDAALQQARAEVEAAAAAVAAAEADVATAESEVQRAEADVARYEQLSERALSRQQRDLATATAEMARAGRQAARKKAAAAAAEVQAAQSRLLAAQAGPRQVAAAAAEVHRREAALQQARASLAAARLRSSWTRIEAPLAGTVTRKNVEPGAYVKEGQTLFAVVSHEVWVIANFKETQLSGMTVGQPARIEIDAVPGRDFAGHVQSLQAGSGVRFSLLPPENATGNYVKVVQRVPVKITFDEQPDPALHLGPGMSAVPEVRVR